MNRGDESENSAATMEINFGNNSWDTISTVEFTPAGTSTYAALALPEGGMKGGDFVIGAFVDGATICTYDLRFTKENGDVLDRKDVNLCDATFYHFEDQ